MYRCDCVVAAQDFDPLDQEGNNMGGTDKNKEFPKKEDSKPGKPPAIVEDDDVEDGDFATPKRDRHGDDDQPL